MHRHNMYKNSVVFAFLCIIHSLDLYDFALLRIKEAVYLNGLNAKLASKCVH